LKHFSLLTQTFLMVCVY